MMKKHPNRNSCGLGRRGAAASPAAAAASSNPMAAASEPSPFRSLIRKATSASTLTVVPRHQAWNLSLRRDPQTAEVRQLEQLFDEEKYQDVIKNAPAVFEAYKFLGWGNVIDGLEANRSWLKNR